MTAILQEIQMFFERLSSRQKMIMLGAVAGIFVLLIAVIVSTIHSEIESYETKLAKKKQNFEQVVDLRDRYKSQQGQTSNKTDDIKNNRVNLHSFVGGLLEKHGMDYKTLSMARGKTDREQNIREETAKVVLQKVELGKLLLLLREIDATNTLVFVKSLSMKRRYDNKEQIDATFYVATLKPMEA